MSGSDLLPPRHCSSRAAALSAAVLLSACVAAPGPPANPFAGAWASPERHQIAFRDDTVIVNPPNEPPTPLSAAACDGTFGFAYERRSRDALLALAPLQPDVRRSLDQLLRQPEYPVAELRCGEGGTTYVLLDERDIVAIHRDRDVAGVEQLTRS